MSFQDYLMAERREAIQEVEAALVQAEEERDAQTERATAAEAERDAQTERATAAEAEWKRVEAQRDALSIENEKLRNELARLQKQVQ